MAISTPIAALMAIMCMLQDLLARVLWLGDKGCEYPWDALRWLKEDVVAELDEREKVQ